MTTENSAAREAQLARIRGLMAKTVDNGCTEAEAASAAEAVDRLLALYEINLDEVTLREQPIGPLDVMIMDHAIKFACKQIALFTDCRVYMKTPKQVVFFGFKVDTEIAEYLTLIFKRAIDREIATVTLFNPDYDRRTASEQRHFKADFGCGMACRLGDRLGELKSKRDFTKRGTGTDLVMIKLPLVNAAMKDAGIFVTNGGRGSRIRDRAAFHAGSAAANNVALNAGIAARADRGGMLR